MAIEALRAVSEEEASCKKYKKDIVTNKWWRRENNAWNGEIFDSYISDMSSNYILMTFLLL